ncbi:sensor histidine kinase [Amycolatopsis australiensis]|uniref:histidine kinase n=1 Tax=Amycolatopsis australiensis TaxID=546364 RepID=A0A1K1T0E6_9PSEU|nr:histidine kinase [Amycolatopsis australiensis]SFW90050.1 Signal transduction histidine kinase [Amycolatopsis australiensis]
MTTGRTGFARRPHGQAYVRWAFIAVPMFAAMPRANTLAWVLIGITLALSVPLLWLYDAGGQKLPPVLLLAVILSAGTLWALVPNSWASVTMFSTTFLVVLRHPIVPILLAVAADLYSITCWAAFHDAWDGALATYTILAVVVLLGLNRRTRLARIEQTELALARAQTATEEHARAAALAERARIARELHDVLAHSLAGLSLNLQGARLMLVRDGASPDAVAQIERAQKLASEGLAEARKAVAALREDAVPVERTIADLLAAYRLDSGARADLKVEGEPRELDAAVGTALVRAVQEALANTRKHAGQADVDVTLDYRSGSVALTVIDRQGRRPPDAPAAGYGLRGMSERVALLDGRFESGPGEDGWRIHLTVPA